MPAEWKDGVKSAPLPAQDGLEEWRTFGIRQTGKLDEANGRTKDTIGIQERCETMLNDALKRKKFLGIF